MGKMIHLLVVEDQPDIRAIIEISLSLDADLVVDAVDSGFAALKYLDSGKPIDVALLDFGLPDVTGLELIAAIKARPGSQPHVIFLTADVFSTSIKRYLAAGAIGVIAKPFDPVTLARRIIDLTASATLQPTA